MKFNKMAAIFALAALGFIAQAQAAHAIGVHGSHTTYGETAVKKKAQKSFKQSSGKTHKAHKKETSKKRTYTAPVVVKLPIVEDVAKAVTAVPKAIESLLTEKAKPAVKKAGSGKINVPQEDRAPKYTKDLSDWSCIGPTVERGEASWYSVATNSGNRNTSSMEPFYEHLQTAAHKTLPHGTVVCVTVNSMGKKGKDGVGVKGLPSERIVHKFRITDRGPYKPGRIIDLPSEFVRKNMEFYPHGLAQVSLQIAQKLPHLKR